MIISVIRGTTRVLGKSQGYLGLPVRDELREGVAFMVSAWEPTADEIAAIQAGAKIEVSIMGTVHPPIMLSVGTAPEGAEPDPEAEKAEWCARFVTYMVDHAGFEKFNCGMPVREYAEMAAPLYYANKDQREEGPDVCADADMDCWEAE